MTRFASLSKFTRSEIVTLFGSTVMRFKKGGLSFRFAPAKKPYGRILIMIPKRAGAAPLRNRLKRRIKALFYEKQWYEYKVDIIISAEKEAVRLSFEELGGIFQSALDAYYKKFPAARYRSNPTNSGDL